MCKDLSQYLANLNRNRLLRLRWLQTFSLLRILWQWRLVVCYFDAQCNCEGILACCFNSQMDSMYVKAVPPYKLSLVMDCNALWGLIYFCRMCVMRIEIEKNKCCRRWYRATIGPAHEGRWHDLLYWKSNHHASFRNPKAHGGCWADAYCMSNLQ